MLNILLDNLLFVSVGWMLLTFLVETVLVAGNGWKVNGKTPLYLYSWEQSYTLPSFCQMFWNTLARYFLLVIIGYIAIGGGVSLVILLVTNFIQPIFIPATLYVAFMIVSGIIFGIGYLMYIVVSNIKEIETKGNVLGSGVKEWYTQIKDKYCPVLTKED